MWGTQQLRLLRFTVLQVYSVHGGAPPYFKSLIFQQVKDERTLKAVWLAALPDAEAAPVLLPGGQVTGFFHCGDELG